MPLDDHLVRIALALREAGDDWLLPDELARRVASAEADLPAALRRLGKDGFRLEVRPGGALRLVSAPDLLDERQIAFSLGTRLLGRRVEVRAETTSTNDLAWADLARGGADGAAFLAEHQTCGRGRLGRAWLAPPRSSVLLSTGVRPAEDGDTHLTGVSPFSLTFAAAVATAEAIQAATGLGPAIEWPNDISLGQRKVAGILVEARRLARAPAFVIGIGVNANVPQAAWPPEVRETATSLAAERGGLVDRVILARHLIRSLDRWYAMLLAQGVAVVHQRWMELAAPVGRRLRVAQDGREVSGVVVDVSPDGALALRLDHGEIRLMRAHSVTVVSREARGV